MLIFEDLGTCFVESTMQDFMMASGLLDRSINPNVNTFKYIPPHIQSDRSFVLLAVHRNVSVLEFVGAKTERERPIKNETKRARESEKETHIYIYIYIYIYRHIYVY